MTNTGTGVQGITRLPKRYNHTAFRDWLLQNFRDIADWRRSIMQNEYEAACRHWFIQGGGDPAEFERLFNNEK